MRTAIATVAVLLYLAAANGHWSEGRAQSAFAQATADKSATPAPAIANAQVSGAAPLASKRALLEQYCLGCHSDRVRSGGLALSQLNLDAVDQNAEIAEKVIRKLRGGLMPPAGVRRPDTQSAADFVSWLENEMDTQATDPHPGRVALRRLN